jgi:hypothetical protein
MWSPKMIDVLTATRKQLKELPERKWGTEVAPFDSIIILPTRRIHDSGYACMDFIGCRNGKAIIRLSGRSDALHLQGDSWNMDCIPKSQLLQFFNFKGKIKAGVAVSSFFVEVVPDGK